MAPFEEDNVRAAAVIAPYHTNGGYPPLGLAYLNALLRQQGCAVSVFDLQFLLALEDPVLRLRLKEYHNVGRSLQLIQPILDLRFTLYCLYADQYPDFQWEMTNELVAEEELPAEERQRLCATYESLATQLRATLHTYAALIAATEPDLVLCSTYISNLLCSLILARELKRLRPATPVLLGGPGVSLPDVRAFILDARLADGVAAGDSEPIVEQILRRWHQTGRIDLDVEGVVVDGARATVTHLPRPDLDALPAPCFDGFPSPAHELSDYRHCWRNEYRSKVFSDFMLPIQTSRGCVLRCAFCSESAIWDGFRPRQPRTIVDELSNQHARYGAQNFSFNASLINHDDAWHRELLERLCTSGLDLKWWGYYRPTPDLTPETAAAMHRAGCRWVSLGVESFYQGALDAMHKGTRSLEAYRAVLALAKPGIFVDFALLTGFPVNEELSLEKEFEASVQFVRALKQRLPGGYDMDIAAGHVVRNEACSRLHIDPERYGIVEEPDPVSIPDELASLAPALSRLGGRWSSRVPLSDKRACAALLVEKITEITGKRPA